MVQNKDVGVSKIIFSSSSYCSPELFVKNC